MMGIKKTKSAKKTKKTNAKSKTKKKANKLKNTPVDTSFVIVDDELEIDKEKEIEEKRAYLEDARSQESSD